MSDCDTQPPAPYLTAPQSIATKSVATPSVPPQSVAAGWVIRTDPSALDLASEHRQDSEAVSAEARARGEARYRAGAYREATSIFVRMCEANSADPNPIRLLGLCRLRLGDPAGALILLAKAHALAPADPYCRLH
jgi:hypothetical protein